MGQINHFVIGVILFFIVVFAPLVVFNSAKDSYNVDISDNYKDMYDQLNTSYEKSLDTGLDVQAKLEQGGGLTPVEGIVTLSTSSYQALVLPFQLLTTMTTMTKTIALEFGIDVFWINGLIAILGISLSFLILKAILRSEGV